MPGGEKTLPDTQATPGTRALPCDLLEKSPARVFVRDPAQLQEADAEPRLQEGSEGPVQSREQGIRPRRPLPAPPLQDLQKVLHQRDRKQKSREKGKITKTTLDF